mgnify:CR=1 FL=1
MVHSMYEHAGAVRIDHVLGLFRLWWIPQGLGARNGAYVTYNHEAMLEVLADRGHARRRWWLARIWAPYRITCAAFWPITACSALTWNGSTAWTIRRTPAIPTARRRSTASRHWHRSPHTSAATAGYLNFEHVKQREELHLLSEPVEVFAASAMAERTAMMNRLVEGGYITQAVADDVEGHVQEIVEAMHAMLTDTPSLLLQAALVDGVGECRSQNQPGTSSEYSNWRVPLADGEGHVVHTDESRTCRACSPCPP